jgi:hypothetical protein
VGDDCWDVMLVSFNIVNPSARATWRTSSKT